MPGVEEIEAAVCQHDAVAPGTRVADIPSERGRCHHLGASRGPAGARRLFERVRFDHGRPDVTDDHGCGGVREPRRVTECESLGRRERHHCRHGIAGAGHVVDLVCLRGVDVKTPGVAATELEEIHPPRATGDEHGPTPGHDVETPHPAGHVAVVVAGGPDARCRVDELRLVRRQDVRVPVARVVRPLGVDQHGRALPRRPRRIGQDAREHAVRQDALAVVGANDATRPACAPSHRRGERPLVGTLQRSWVLTVHTQELLPPRHDPRLEGRRPAV